MEISEYKKILRYKNGKKIEKHIRKKKIKC